MQIAIVRGTVVSTQKEPSLRGSKLLLVQYTDVAGHLLSKYEVVADNIGAGRDEWVLVSRGGAAREIPGGQDLPVDARVVGIIDTVNMDNQMIYDKKNQQF